ncbi:hypothetical protein [Thalassotalea mangrovi]|uniref:DUF1794 domain-containing protein n=1 Tax=Thalassotalea mangrovi TaxID=2572245 RepID=A0A4U1B1C3_9GAMM|nr:hypothetical protein [Thalassotalea mangrovi]TKB43038.1 hypothetical protein E8M12_16070 [Thalassotalea mangrovi]
MRMNSKNLLFIFLAVVVFVLYSPFATQAADDATASSLTSVMHQTAGVWRGELYYLDYQSGERYFIPMQVEASLSTNQDTLIRQFTFTDPNHVVYATQLLTLNEQESSLAEAYFRDNQGECFDYEITKVQIVDEKHWRVEFQNKGLDDGRQALVLMHYERKGNKLFSEKKVRYLDDSDEAVFLRNGSKLTLMER